MCHQIMAGAVVRWVDVAAQIEATDTDEFCV